MELNRLRVRKQGLLSLHNKYARLLWHTACVRLGAACRAAPPAGLQAGASLPATTSVSCHLRRPSTLGQACGGLVVWRVSQWASLHAALCSSLGLMAWQGFRGPLTGCAPGDRGSST